MAEINRVTLFGKLNQPTYKAVEGATVFCKLRGNPHVELEHVLAQLLQSQDSDWHRVEIHLSKDRLRPVIEGCLLVNLAQLLLVKPLHGVCALISAAAVHSRRTTTALTTTRVPRAAGCVSGAACRASGVA